MYIFDHLNNIFIVLIDILHLQNTRKNICDHMWIELNFAQIRPLFEEHGNVVEVALIKDRRTGQQQGKYLLL